MAKHLLMAVVATRWYCCAHPSLGKVAGYWRAVCDAASREHKYLMSQHFMLPSSVAWLLPSLLFEGSPPRFLDCVCKIFHAAQRGCAQSNARRTARVEGPKKHGQLGKGM
eukprot:TRINITY_DN76724_c0_g1_i1.p2 TRINITY_DN76724_c0_g1~~TRINITY_DN76724_c0_g1_i1.p2  ORF type:complete len:110 (-),score=3.88 TRINITY_DN76724_c0_g1_i1:16-345(-)